MRCPKCNFPVLPKFDKCPKCGTPLKESAPAAADFDFDAPVAKPTPKTTPAADFDFDAPAAKPVATKVAQPVDGVSIISGKAVWSLGPGQIARRVSEREMADCGAVKGVVVQDGVTAAVFSDGKLVQTLDGGIYRFSNEIVRREGKPVTMTPQNTEAPAQAAPVPVEEKKRGFLSRLFGAKKEESVGPAASRPAVTAKPKPAPAEQRNTSVVVIYLISNRVFEETFGSAGSVDYAPFEVTAAGTPLKVGASMQMRVTDFETFRRQYLVDSNEVSVETLRRLMTPWVKQILEHAFASMQVADGQLTDSQQESLKQTLGSMLQNRLFGLSIINIFDLSTRDDDFETLRKQHRQLMLAERENEVQMRETEFRNRLADYEAQQDAERLTKENDTNLSREKEYARFETALAELNRDKLLTEDELKQFMAQHEMEMRLAEAARNADEKTRAYETEKILNELADKKLIDEDERKALAERVENGQFERGQLNDILRHKALVSTTLEKLRLDTDLAMQQANASHEHDLNGMRQENERTDLESVLYGKRYAIDRQKAVDELELKSIRLDADLETRRKEDAYAEEKYLRDKTHDHDEWAEKFMREGKEMDRSREYRRADADLDFDIRSRNEEHDFEMGRKRDEHDFDMTSRKAEFDFDLDDRRQDKDIDRTVRLDEHGQNIADRELDRSLNAEARRQELEHQHGDHEFDLEAKKANLDFDLDSKKAQLDFDLDDRRQDKDVERTVRLDEHGQNIADREHARARTDKHDDFEMESQRKAQDFDIDSKKAQLDFDLDDRRHDKDVERTVRLDEHGQNIADREHARNREAKRDDFDMESQRKAQDFDFESRRAQMDLDAADRAQQRRMAEKNLDFEHQETHADKEVERTTKISAVEQEAADRQHARDMEMRRQQQEELRLKGNIAMENMKAMMEAKRAAKKDELDAATDHLNIRSQMTAEQLAAEQLRDLDASAQAGFMDALREKSSSAKEAELARREAEMTRQMHEQMMGRADSMHEQNRNDLKEMMAQMMQMQQMSQQQAMDLARHSMDTSATIASAQAASNATAAERRAADLERDNQRYREDARHAQERVDSNQAQSLNYTTRVTETEMKTDRPAPTAAEVQSAREEVATVPLNTAWLRSHGFAGSFNELAGQLSSLGASISKDFDADGNPIIVVDGLAEGQVFDTLQAFGVEF